jgi:CBS domain-containing protein
MVFLPESVRRFEERFHKAAAATAAEMMTPDPVTVEADDSARKAGRLIADTGHNRLPVLEDGRVVGVVTRVDVLGALAAE